jgi:hypothetical protein
VTTRIIVAADNRSLSLGLAGLDYDVVDVDPAELSSWQVAAQSAGVLVVGVDDSDAAMRLVRSVDELRPGLPSLVVCGDPEGWSALQADGLNIEILPLPVTRPALVTAIEKLTKKVPPVTPPPPPPASATPARRIVAARSTDALRERLANNVGDHVARSNADRDRELEQLRPPVVHEPTVPDPLPRTDNVRELVRALLVHRHQLYDVRDAARAVLDESAVVTDVLAGVVMLPDVDVWRVCAAVGARPLEWRYVLEPDSWIVTTVVDGNRGVIVEDTDIARQRLGGAPLAHHTQLMILPIPGPRGVIVLAREAEPFTETDLSSLAKIAADAGPVLSDGLAVRELARALNEFRGVDE